MVPKRKLFAVSVLALLFLSMFAGLGVWQIKPARATYIFEDDFELGNGYGGWTGTSGSPAIATSPVHSGINSSKVTDGTKYSYQTISATGTIYFRYYVYLNALLAVDGDYVINSRIGTTQCGAGVVRTGGVTLWRLVDSHATYHDATTGPSLHQWYSVELEYAGTDGANDDKLFIDGNSTPVATGAGRVATQTDVRVGMISRSGTMPDMYFDDCVADSGFIGGTGDYNHMTGDQLVAGLLPSQNYWIVQPNATYYSIKADYFTLVSSTNGYYVLSQTIGNLSSGNSLQVNASITMSAIIYISPSNLVLNVQNATLTLSANANMFRVNGLNVTFLGSQSVTTRSHWHGYASGGPDNQAINVHAGNCTIEGIEFIGFGGTSEGTVFADYAASGYMTVQNCVFDDNYPINIQAGTYNTVTNCTMVGIANGIFIAPLSTHNNISYCDFSDWSHSIGHAIYLDGGAYVGGYNTIHDCIFHNNTGTNGAGLQIKCPYNVIYNCMFYNFTTSGSPALTIYSEYSQSYANYNDVYNNTLISLVVGIWVGHNPADSITTGNKIHDNTFTSVANCIYLNPWSGAINFTDGTEIYNNTFTSCTTIFPASGSSPSLIRDTVIRDNDFNGISVGSWVTTCTNTTIYNNTEMTGYYMLNMSVVGNGITVPDGLGWQYYTGTTASVIWEPIGGNSRVDFSKDGENQTTTESPINITMSADHVGIAYFSDTGAEVTVTITLPTNTTYTTSTISVQLSASGGTIDTILWNCTYANGTVVYANTVYTVPTNMTLENGAYIFNARANNTDGEWDEETVMFTVTISASSVTLVIASPSNTTYTSPTIPISMSASGGTIDRICWNIQFENSSWLYVENQTYTVATSSMIDENLTATFFGWANNTDGNSDDASVMFTVYLVSNTLGYQLSQAAVAAAGFMGIVMLLGMVYVALEGKDVKFAVMLAVGEVLLLVTMLVLSQLAILG